MGKIMRMKPWFVFPLNLKFLGQACDYNYRRTLRLSALLSYIIPMIRFPASKIKTDMFLPLLLNHCLDNWPKLTAEQITNYNPASTKVNQMSCTHFKISHQIVSAIKTLSQRVKKGCSHSFMFLTKPLKLCPDLMSGFEDKTCAFNEISTLLNMA